MWPANHDCLRCICVGPLPIVAQTWQRNRLVGQRLVEGGLAPEEGGFLRSWESVGAGRSVLLPASANKSGLLGVRGTAAGLSPAGLRGWGGRLCGRPNRQRNHPIRIPIPVPGPVGVLPRLEWQGPRPLRVAPRAERRSARSERIQPFSIGANRFSGPPGFDHMAIVETAAHRNSRTFMAVTALLIRWIRRRHSGRGRLVLDDPFVCIGQMAESGRVEYPTGLSRGAGADGSGVRRLP